MPDLSCLPDGGHDGVLDGRRGSLGGFQLTNRISTVSVTSRRFIALSYKILRS
jgi:hypothetical protein